jgi:sialate O-acetylesterase
LIYRDDSVKSGPLPVNAKRGRATVVVDFGGVDGKLVAVDAAQPVAFELCGPAQQTCRFVSATIHGNAVALSLPRGVNPTRVRYCWSDGPVCTLYDSSRIPAVPFELSLNAQPRPGHNRHTRHRRR